MKADLNELIINEIYKFMDKENIPFIGFRFNGDEHYKADGNLSKEHKKILTEKLKKLATTEEKINLSIKHIYGSFEKLDKLKGVSRGTHRAKFKRRLKAWREMLDIINVKESINSK